MNAEHSPLNGHSKPPCAKPSCRPPSHRVKPQAPVWGQGPRSHSGAHCRARTRTCGFRDRPRRPARADPSSLPAQDVDPPGCRNVRLSDVGWTDVASTTALTAELLRKSATPRASRSCRCRSRSPRSGTRTSMCSSATGCRPRSRIGHLTTPTARWSSWGTNISAPSNPGGTGLYLRPRPQGLQRHPSIRGPAEQFDLRHRAGNDGNRLVLKMIKDNQYDLGRFQAGRIE